jgi:hypothetical protein
MLHTNIYFVILSVYTFMCNESIDIHYLSIYKHMVCIYYLHNVYNYNHLWVYSVARIYVVITYGNTAKFITTQ